MFRHKLNLIRSKENVRQVLSPSPQPREERSLHTGDNKVQMDPYKVLLVRKNAHYMEIEEAYTRLSKLHTEKMKTLEQSYYLLGNPLERSLYNIEKMDLKKSHGYYHGNKALLSSLKKFLGILSNQSVQIVFTQVDGQILTNMQFKENCDPEKIKLFYEKLQKCGLTVRLLNDINTIVIDEHPEDTLAILRKKAEFTLNPYPTDFKDGRINERDESYLLGQQVRRFFNFKQRYNECKIFIMPEVMDSYIFIDLTDRNLLPECCKRLQEIGLQASIVPAEESPCTDAQSILIEEKASDVIQKLTRAIKVNEGNSISKHSILSHSMKQAQQYDAQQDLATKHPQIGYLTSFKK